MSIKLKLTILFLAVAAIPAMLIGVLSFHNYKKTLEAVQLSHLQHLTSYKADIIETFFTGLKTNITVQQKFFNIRKNLPTLNRLANDANNPEFLAADKMLNDQLQDIQRMLGLYNIILLNPQGRIVYSTSSAYYSKDFLNTLPDPGQQAFENGKHDIYVSDIFCNKQRDSRLEMLVTAPVSDFNNVFIGVVAFEVDMTSIYNLIDDTTGLGMTGETLIGKKTGDDVEFLNPLRHDPQAAVNRKVKLGDASAFPIQQAVNGKTGTGIAIDYRGKRVIAAWRYLPSLDWGLVAKIDTREAFADILKLEKLVAAIVVVIVIFAALIAFSIARSIAEPIKKLVAGAEIVGSGNLDHKVVIDLNDEIGQLSRSFDKMTLDLKRTTASRDELNREILERKKVEEALHTSREDLSRAQSVGNIGSWRMNVQSNELTWSDQNHRIFGIPKGTAMTYRTFLSTVHPDDLDFIDKKWKAALDGEPYDFEHRIIVDGSVKWVREKASLEFDKDGALIGGFGITQDITERKRTEEALRQSERLYRGIGETIDYGVWVCEPDGRNTYASESFLKMVGITQQQCSEFGWGDVLHPDDAERTIAAWKECVRTGGNWDIEHRFRGADGQWHNVLARGVPVRDEKGMITCWAGINLDITRIKQSEQAMLASEARYRRLFEAARDGILILDADSGLIVDVNPFIENTLGYSHEEFLDKKIWEIGLFKNIVASKTSFLKLQTKGYVRYEDLPLETKDGRRVNVEFISNVYLVNNKKVIQCNIRDITDRKRNEDELRRMTAHSKLLSDTAQKLLLTEKPINIIDELCSKVLEYLDCSIFINYLVDESVNRLHLNSSGGLPDKTAETMEWLDFGQAIGGKVAQTGKRIVVENIHESCDESADFVRSIGIKAYCCHPLISQGKVIGTLAFGTKTHQSFTPDHIKLMNTIADLVAIAIAREQSEELIHGLNQDLARSRYELEIKVNERTKELRNLTAELVLVEEHERHKVAEALHDSLGPILSFSKRELGNLEKTVPQQAAESLNIIRKHLNDAIKQTRELTFDLSPSSLYDLGFEISVEELLEGFAKERNIQFVFTDDEQVKPLSKDSKILLYRSIRELLINVAKHAQTTAINLSLARVNGDIRIILEDNGKGFDVSGLSAKTGRSRGFGLFSVKERLAHIGGKFNIESEIGKGTKITIEAPLEKTTQ